MTSFQLAALYSLIYKHIKHILTKDSDVNSKTVRSATTNWTHNLTSKLIHVTRPFIILWL